MSRRPGRELEREPHYVYYHENAKGDVIYVGRTALPETRPTDTRRRAWIATESKHLEISPPMPFDLACWVEEHMIRTLYPKHNTRGGTSGAPTDPRIDLLCEALGMTRADARWNLRYGWPTDLEAFRAELAAVLGHHSNATADPLSMTPGSAARQVRAS